MRRAMGVLVLAISPTVMGAPPAGKGTLDTARIEQLTGLKGKLDDQEGVFKVSLPRSDISATAGGVRLVPALGLTAWAAFQGTGDHVMVMGDMVLTEDQVNPVMSAALDAGLEVTALHNHFFWDSPKIMFMHIGGMGPEDKIATAVGKVIARIKETMGGKGAHPTADIDPARSSFDPKKIEAVLGAGELKDGVFKVTVGRTTRMSAPAASHGPGPAVVGTARKAMGGHEVGKAMGVNTWAAFAGSDDKAVVDGDFAMLESELQGVLRSLRASGISIVAIHNHMAGEEPRMLFLHFWGLGGTEKLAHAIASALALTAAGKPR